MNQPYFIAIPNFVLNINKKKILLESCASTYHTPSYDDM